MSYQHYIDLSRRESLQKMGTGLGILGLAGILAQDGTLAAEPNSSFSGSPLSDRSGHFAPRAKHIIHLFMNGGPSQVDTFDPKPELDKHDGKRPMSADLKTERKTGGLLKSPFAFKPYGESGIEVSDLFPHIGSCIDDIAVVRSMWTTDDNHGAQVQFHSGRHMLDPRVPTIGAWINYGLGTLNENLPQFIGMGPRYFDRSDGHYLGPAYDEVKLKIDPKNPLDYHKPQGDFSREEQRLGFGLVNRLNKLTAANYPADSALEARIKSYELAFRMQTSVPDVVNFESETESTKNLYGFDQKETRPFGQQLLSARRFVERGVRFIQIMHGGGAAGAWDAHGGLKANHTKLAMEVDRPIAGLLKDLKQRGLLEETLVVFATEFGRTPGSQGSNGRDHHVYGFSVWMAGGGIKGGVTHGATDEIGFHAIENPHYVTDIHATILQQLGLESHRMEIPGHKRLEQDFGHVINEIIA